MNVQSVAVIGSGLMGRGIACVSAVGGFETRLFDVSAAALEQARAQIRRDLEEGQSRGKLEAGQAAAALERLRPHTSLEAALDGVDFVIEAVPEDLRLKLETFQKNDVIIREQEASDGFYLMKGGEVEVYSDRRGYVLLSKLHHGDFFGEIAAVTKQPRTASVRALCPTEVLRLSAADLQELAANSTRRPTRLRSHQPNPATL